MIDHRDPHTGLHSEQGALAGEHPGRAANPVVKVHDLAWLEFEKPDLRAGGAVRPGVRVHDGAAHRRTSCSCAARDAGAPCVLIRKGPRSRFLGAGVPGGRPDRRAAARRRDRADGHERCRRAWAGSAVDLVDPSGPRVRVVADTHELPALPGQAPLTFNFGHTVDADQRHAAAAAAAGARCSGSVTWCCRPRPLPCRRWTGTCEHLGPDRQRLPVLRRAARARAGDELHPLRPRRDPDRPPHAGDGARPGQPLRALGLPGRRPRRAGRRRGVPARAGLPAVVGDRPAHPGQPDLRLLARPGRVPGRALQPTATCSTAPSSRAGRR